MLPSARRVAGGVDWWSAPRPGGSPAGGKTAATRRHCWKWVTCCRHHTCPDQLTEQEVEMLVKER